MNKKYSLIFVLALSLALAGCGKAQIAVDKNAPEAKGGGEIQGNDLNPESNQVFDEAPEVDLPDSDLSGAEQEIRPVLKNAFGNLKSVGYSDGMFGSGSLMVQYISEDPLSGNSLNDLSRALKAKGFDADSLGGVSVINGGASGFFSGKEYDLQVVYAPGEQNLSVNFIPASISE